MPRTVSASEAKSRFGSIVEWVNEHDDEVIIRSYGEPRAVLLSYAEYQRIEKQRQQANRRAALERLRQLRQEVRARNQDLDERQATELADRFVREVIEEMVQEGKVSFTDE